VRTDRQSVTDRQTDAAKTIPVRSIAGAQVLRVPAASNLTLTNTNQLRLGCQMQIWFTFIPFIDKLAGVRVKRRDPLTTRVMPESSEVA